MSASPFQFGNSYLPALEPRGAAAEALNREGRLLRERGEISAAIAKHQEALRLKPDAAATHQNLALAWWRRGNLPEALAAYRRVMELRPNSAAAHSDYLYALYHDSSCGPAQLFEESRRWAGKFAVGRVSTRRILSVPGERRVETRVETRPTGRRLRLGYVSADFRRHTLQHFILPLLKAHDRSIVEWSAASARAPASFR
jgi:protein O-GlcNAc transferase